MLRRTQSSPVRKQVRMDYKHVQRALERGRWSIRPAEQISLTLFCPDIGIIPWFDFGEVNIWEGVFLLVFLL